MIKLREYQKKIAEDGVEILKEYKILFLAMEVRTGKTLTALSVAEKYRARKVLFVTKKKAIASIENDYKKLNPGFEIVVINYESIHKVDIDPDLIILDESHGLGAFPKPSQRAKSIKERCKNKPIIFLSGTPSPESYSQLFHQFYVSSFSPFEEKSFYRWAAKYVVIKEKYINSMKIRDYSKAKNALIQEKINHLILTCTQKEAGFEAFVNEKVLTVPAGSMQDNLSQQLKDHKITYLAGKVATVKSGADLINKLSQISSGTLIVDDEDDGIVFDGSKANFIAEEFARKKIAIFYKYRAELEILKLRFPNYTESPEEFNSREDLVFLGQIRSAREGVNLSTADALVMYNIDFSATSYFQARSRIQSKDREGGAPLYWIFTSGGIEFKIYEAVQKKKNFTHSYYKQCEKAQSKKGSLNASGVWGLFASR